MKIFLLHILLTCALVLFIPLKPIWLAWVTAFAAVYALLALVCLTTKKSRYPIHFYRSIALFIYFNYELLTSSLKVLWDIITPQHKSMPGFIAMPLDAVTDMEIFLTANLISLTPGTLSMDVSDDRKTLYIHAMFIDDLPQTIQALKKFEARILGVLR